MKQQIEAEHRKRMDALELLWKDFGEKSNLQGKMDFVKSPKGELTSGVQEIVKMLDSDFSVENVAEKLKISKPNLSIKRPSISTVLKRLVDEGQIQIVEVGKGRRATIYKRT